MRRSDFSFAAAPTPEDLAAWPLNDLGNAMRLILLAGGRIEADGEIDSSSSRLLYLLGSGWVGFNGRFWDRKFGEELARRLAHQVAGRVRDLYQVLVVERDVPAKEFWKFANECGSAGKTSAMLRQAQSYLMVEIDAFDRDPLAINCLNGTLKIQWRPKAAEGEKFGVELMPHDPADRITRCAEVEYDRTATAPLFRATLAASLPDEAERGAFGRMMGYAATGFIHEQAFFFNQGPGQDGKSTLLDACRETLGSYGVAVRPETFLEAGPQGGGGPQPELMALAGDTRMAIVSEPKRGAKLNEGLLKAWTSGSPISARDLHAKPINFRPVTKLIWEMNSFVVAKGDDDGIWRRIKPVLFRKKVPDDRVDRLLPEKLRGEKAGILNWLVACVGEWLELGLDWPESLRDVVDDYRRSSSPFGDWLSERCVWGEAAEGERTLSGALYADYKSWCEEQGNDRPMSVRAFGDALRDRQVRMVGKDGSGKKLRGPIRLKTALEIADDIRAANAGLDDAYMDATGPGGASPDWEGPQW